jgi:signal peptidase
MQFNNDTISLLIRTIRKYGWMDLPSNGTSMYPFIQKGNVCRFVSFNSKEVKKGDILLYHSPSGQLIAHRLLRVKEKNNQFFFELKGDTNLCNDGPILQEQIIGKLVIVNKEKKQIYMDDFSSVFWSFIITTFPNVSKLLKTYLAFKENLKIKLGISI